MAEAGKTPEFGGEHRAARQPPGSRAARAEDPERQVRSFGEEVVPAVKEAVAAQYRQGTGG